MRIFIAGLPYEVADDELRLLLERYGTVTSATVAIDRERAHSKGFGFVCMPNEREGEAAVADLDGCQWGGRTLHVEPARDKPRTLGRRAPLREI
jgi:RNA recognition motif-containing protein